VTLCYTRWLGLGHNEESPQIHNFEIKFIWGVCYNWFCYSGPRPLLCLLPVPSSLPTSSLPLPLPIQCVHTYCKCCIVLQTIPSPAPFWSPDSNVGLHFRWYSECRRVYIIVLCHDHIPCHYIRYNLHAALVYAILNIKMFIYAHGLACWYWIENAFFLSMAFVWCSYGLEAPNTKRHKIHSYRRNVGTI